eukprot:XP_013982815.1 PREDICTED: LOW QUALITY PROTEIN: talin-2-like [Salmo salar]
MRGQQEAKDFGEYQESYYSVQTTEGEQISQLIAGYIDIILKKKQSKDRFGLEGDEESTMLEESVSPKKSTILQQQFNRVGRVEHGSVALPGVIRSGSIGTESLSMGTMPSAQQQVIMGQMHRGHMPPLSSAQQALMGTINTSMQAVQQAQADLGEVDNLPPLGQDMASKVWIQNKVDESKHEIHSQVDAITAGTASVVNLTAGDPTDTDYTAVGCAITTISSNLTEMSKGVKLLAALIEDDTGGSNDLMGAARNLAGAVSDLLKAVEPASGEPRQTVLSAAGSVGQASGDLLLQMGENESDERFQEVLMNLAKAVANAAAMMVLKAKNVAQVADDTVLQNRVIAAATQCALSTSQLVACAKVVSPTISSPVCQEQLIEAGKLVDRSVEGCVQACLSATVDGEMLKQVSAAASVVGQALGDLLEHVCHYASHGEPIGRYDQATDTIMTVTESIFSSMGDAGEMVRQARVLAQATSDLVNAMRLDAEVEVDVDNSKKLLAAAKLLADATARMVEAAKGAAAYPENEDQQQRLREAAEGLRVATNAAAQNAIKKKLINRLENAAKQAAAAATQTIAASQNAAASNKNTAAHQQLVQSCKAMADHIPRLVQGVRGSQAQPEDLTTQLALIITSQNFLQPGSKMVTSAKSSVPTVMDQAAAMQLGQCAKNLATSLAELRTAAQKAQEACGPMEIHSALTAVQTLKTELQDAKMAAIDMQLKPLPGESLEKCAQDLGSTSKSVGSSMAQLLTCAAQGNEHYTGSQQFRPYETKPEALATCHGNTCRSLEILPPPSVSLSVSVSLLPLPAPPPRENILKTAKALVEDTKMLVSGAASSQDRLAQAAQSSAKTITQLTDVVKLGAASIGSDDPETQVVLINAVKDVAKALAELIGATKCAAGKAADDPSMYQLKSAAKVMVTNVTSLLKTVKAVEDEATRGTRALEATIECIKQELTVFQSKDVPEKSTTPEEFIRMTKGITTATAKAVAAGNSARQEDVISTANLSRKAIFDMLTTCKQAAYHQEVNKDVRSRALLYGTECTTGYIDLLEHVLLVLQGPTAEQKQQLVFYSKRVAGAVTELIQTAEAMKGTEWVDPEDPTVIAETELLGAAASIEAAAKKLEQLKPRAKPKQADETLDFEEQILEAAKSIAAATSALVKSASAAQRELVAQGKVGSIPANAVDDGQWSQGLISAARMVAAATSNLCEAANASVQGQASEEKLISSAKQVAASTAQLLVACKVKADQDSEAMRRLQAAGNAVKRASDNLVRAAQKAAFHKADDDNVVVKTKFVGGIAQIIAAQEEMLRKERELEEARKKLAQIRQQQYKFLPSELREDEN